MMEELEAQMAQPIASPQKDVHMATPAKTLFATPEPKLAEKPSPQTRPSASKVSPKKVAFQDAMPVKEEEPQSWYRRGWSEWSHDSSSWDEGWGDDSWPRRSWSSLSWDQSWGHETEKHWSLSRGYSQDLEPRQHPGWGGKEVSESEQTLQALQRAATTVEEQHRPSQACSDQQSKPAASVEIPATVEEKHRSSEPCTDEPLASVEIPATVGEKHRSSEPCTDEPPASVEIAATVEEKHRSSEPCTDEPPASVEIAATVEEKHRSSEPCTDEQSKPPASVEIPAGQRQPAPVDPDRWRKDRNGSYIKPHALYMRFYRNIRREGHAGNPLHPKPLAQVVSDHTIPSNTYLTFRMPL